MSVQQMSRAEELVKGMNPKQMLGAVFDASSRLENVRTDGKSRLTDKNFDDAMLAGEGLRAVVKAGKAQGADLPDKVAAADPMAKAKSGGFILNNMMEFAAGAAATAALGSGAGIWVGAAFAARQIGKMAFGGGPPAEMGVDSRVKSSQGYFSSPLDASRKGSDVYGAPSAKTASFAAHSDQAVGSPQRRMGSFDVLASRGQHGMSMSKRPSVFDQAFSKVKVTPAIYREANDRLKMVEQQTANLTEALAKPKMNAASEGVVSQGTMEGRNLAMYARMIEDPKATQVGLMDTGYISSKTLKNFAGHLGSYSPARPDMGMAPAPSLG